jgi:hypothetical protein
MELQKTIEQAIDILRRWELGDTHFTLTTSGSTGDPSAIEHSREALQWSAESTLNMWFTSSDQTEENTPLAPIQLCILPLNKAGGFMQLIRSAVWNAPIWIGPASGNPFFDAQGSKSHQSLNHLGLELMLDGEVFPYNTELWNRYKATVLSIKNWPRNPKSNAHRFDWRTGNGFTAGKTDFGGISKDEVDSYFWLHRNRFPFCRPYTKSQHTRIYPYGRLLPQHQ